MLFPVTIMILYETGPAPWISISTVDTDSLVL